MNGGIDLVYLRRFGWELQTRLQAHTAIPYLVSAPTMRIPMNVSNTINAYLAFRAAIRAVKLHNRVVPGATIRTVMCPGLCTAIGRMPADLSARQMAAAFEACVLNQFVGPGGHRYLLGA